MDRSSVPVTDADREAFIQDQVAGTEDGNDLRERRQELEDMPRMEFRPPYGAIFADAAGYLFVEEYSMPGAEMLAVDVFDPEGRLVGRFELPAAFEVLEVGQDHLMGIFQDDMEVEYLLLYDLTRPPS